MSHKSDVSSWWALLSLITYVFLFLKEKTDTTEIKVGTSCKNNGCKAVSC